MSKGLKVDLTLLKRLVGELEVALATADGVKEEAVLNSNDYVVEVSKASGLATGVMLEASMLVGDIQAMMKLGAQPGTSSKDDPFGSLMSALKGGKFGGTN